MPIQTTVRDFINSAAVAARYISPGMSMSGNQIQTWLDAFSDLARTWSVDRQFGFFIPDVPYILPAAQESYDIGPTATNYNTTANPALVRPLFVESARSGIGFAPYRRWPLNVLTEQQFASVPGRGITDPNGPLNIYYAAGLQNGTFNFAPLGVNNQTILRFAVESVQDLRYNGPRALHGDILSRGVHPGAEVEFGRRGNIEVQPAIATGAYQ